MTITIDSELEHKIRLAAAQHGQDVFRYAVDALRRQLMADAQTDTRHDLHAEMAAAAKDPLFLADVEETERLFQNADAQTAGMLSHE